MPRPVQYVSELADRIGPRPATTDAEADAAEWIESMFVARGLEVQRQDFDCPRTYSWAFVTYHALTIAAVVGAQWPFLRWPAVAVAVLVAVLMWFDLDTRWGLSNLMPKGPSQNIIARQIPKTRRGEHPRRVVVVAHYDSATASLAFSPALVKNFSATFGLMKWCTALVPVLLAVHALPAAESLDPYAWYAAAVVAAYLLVPLVINVHRELLMPAADGANDNASGVATLLGVMDMLLPEGAERAITEASAGRAAEHVPAAAELPADEGLLEFTPAQTSEEEATELPSDFEWAEPGEMSEGQGTLEFDTVEFEAVGFERPRPTPAEQETLPPESGTPDRQGPEARRRGLFGLVGRGQKRREEHLGGWLGVEENFDVRDEGRKIGSWEQFESDEEEDGFGFKGGSAGGDPLTDPDFAADEAARIRRKVTESVDRALAEKDVWFVATGAEEAGTWGMRAFLDAHATELRGAYIINVDNVGTGTLHWVTSEGMARRYASDRRLVSTARNVSRKDEILAKGRAYRGLSTDATPALARGFKAMSVMAFDINGRLPNWHWRTDTSANVQPEALERAVSLVAGIIRDL